MPLNLLKKYNQLLEIDHLQEKERTKSLRMIFDRDIRNNYSFKFRSKKINPINVETDAMELLFSHLTTIVIDLKTRKREFDFERSKRLHWIKYHIEENEPSKISIFSVEDPNGIRTYIYDKDERYVIILEPYRNGKEYYLLSAYHLNERNRGKIRNKYNRRLDIIF